MKRSPELYIFTSSFISIKREKKRAKLNLLSIIIHNVTPGVTCVIGLISGNKIPCTVTNGQSQSIILQICRIKLYIISIWVMIHQHCCSLSYSELYILILSQLYQLQAIILEITVCFSILSCTESPSKICV